MSVGRILAAALVGGIVMFAWGAIEHEATPLGLMGLSTLPHDEPLLSQIRDAVPDDGLYFVPGIDMKKATKEELEEWQARNKKGPAGLLLIHKTGVEMTPKLLINECVSNILAAFILALIFSRWPVSKMTAGLLGLGIGVYGWISIVFSYWNWYGFPGSFSFAALVEQAVGGFLSGIAIALVLGRKRQPAVI